jgi:hypothetical protein
MTLFISTRSRQTRWQFRYRQGHQRIRETKFEGVGGEITFDEMHDVQTGKGKMNLIFAQWQDKGERAGLDPKELRTGTFILPPWMKK